MSLSHWFSPHALWSLMVNGQPQPQIHHQNRWTLRACRAHWRSHSEHWMSHQCAAPTLPGNHGNTCTSVDEMVLWAIQCIGYVWRTPRRLADDFLLGLLDCTPPPVNYLLLWCRFEALFCLVQDDLLLHVVHPLAVAVALERIVQTHVLIQATHTCSMHTCIPRM